MEIGKVAESQKEMPFYITQIGVEGRKSNEISKIKSRYKTF